VVVGKHYKTFTLKQGWETKQRDINWAETAAFELLVQVLATKGYVGPVLVKSDSATALRAITGSKVRVQNIIDSAQRLNAILKVSAITLHGIKVLSKANLADPFTKGKVIEGYHELEDSIAIPKALAPFMIEK
jgi:hypothetical protein